MSLGVKQLPHPPLKESNGDKAQRRFGFAPFGPAHGCDGFALNEYNADFVTTPQS